MKQKWIIRVLSLTAIMVLCIEWKYVHVLFGNNGNGMISILPCCFMLLLTAYTFENLCVPICLRKVSTYIFFCHVPYGTTIGFVINRLFHTSVNNILGNIVRYIVTCGCIIITYYIVEKKECFIWRKNNNEIEK